MNLSGAKKLMKKKSHSHILQLLFGLITRLLSVSAFLMRWPAGTVWKFGNFSITQFLREINFRDSKSAKTAILTHKEALKCDFYELLHFLKAEIYQINKI